MPPSTSADSKLIHSVAIANLKKNRRSLGASTWLGVQIEMQRMKKAGHQPRYDQCLTDLQQLKEDNPHITTEKVEKSLKLVAFRNLLNEEGLLGYDPSSDEDSDYFEDNIFPNTFNAEYTHRDAVDGHAVLGDEDDDDASQFSVDTAATVNSRASNRSISGSFQPGGRRVFHRVKRGTGGARSHSPRPSPSTLSLRSPHRSKRCGSAMGKTSHARKLSKSLTPSRRRHDDASSQYTEAFSQFEDRSAAMSSQFSDMSITINKAKDESDELVEQYQRRFFSEVLLNLRQPAHVVRFTAEPHSTKLFLNKYRNMSHLQRLEEQGDIDIDRRSPSFEQLQSGNTKAVQFFEERILRYEEELRNLKDAEEEEIEKKKNDTQELIKESAQAKVKTIERADKDILEAESVIRQAQETIRVANETKSKAAPEHEKRVELIKAEYKSFEDSLSSGEQGGRRLTSSQKKIQAKIKAAQATLATLPSRLFVKTALTGFECLAKVTKEHPSADQYEEVLYQMQHYLNKVKITKPSELSAEDCAEIKRLIAWQPQG